MSKHQQRVTDAITRVKDSGDLNAIASVQCAAMILDAAEPGADPKLKEYVAKLTSNPEFLAALVNMVKKYAPELANTLGEQGGSANAAQATQAPAEGETDTTGVNAMSVTPEEEARNEALKAQQRQAQAKRGGMDQATLRAMYKLHAAGDQATLRALHSLHARHAAGDGCTELLALLQEVGQQDVVHAALSKAGIAIDADGRPVFETLMDVQRFISFLPKTNASTAMDAYFRDPSTVKDVDDYFRDPNAATLDTYFAK
jgi:hypothetical protein